MTTVKKSSNTKKTQTSSAKKSQTKRRPKSQSSSTKKGRNSNRNQPSRARSNKSISTKPSTSGKVTSGTKPTTSPAVASTNKTNATGVQSTPPKTASTEASKPVSPQSTASGAAINQSKVASETSPSSQSSASVSPSIDAGSSQSNASVSPSTDTGSSQSNASVSPTTDTGTDTSSSQSNSSQPKPSEEKKPDTSTQQPSSDIFGALGRSFGFGSNPKKNSDSEAQPTGDKKEGADKKESKGLFGFTKMASELQGQLQSFGQNAKEMKENTRERLGLKPDEATTKNIQEMQRLLAPDKLGGADGTFDHADASAVAQGLVRHDAQGILNQPETISAMHQGIRNAAAQKVASAPCLFRGVAGRAANKRLTPGTMAHNKHYPGYWQQAQGQALAQAPSTIKERIQGDLSANGIQTGKGQVDSTPRNVRLSDMDTFKSNATALQAKSKEWQKIMDKELGYHFEPKSGSISSQHLSDILAGNTPDDRWNMVKAGEVASSPTTGNTSTPSGSSASNTAQGSSASGNPPRKLSPDEYKTIAPQHDRFASDQIRPMYFDNASQRYLYVPKGRQGSDYQNFQPAYMNVNSGQLYNGSLEGLNSKEWRPAYTDLSGNRNVYIPESWEQEQRYAINP